MQLSNAASPATRWRVSHSKSCARAHGARRSDTSPSISPDDRLFGGPAMRTTHVALLGVLVLTTACSKPDVTKSAEYAALQRRLDGATADLGDARDEVAAAQSQIERLDGNAVAMQATIDSEKNRIIE